jgi:glucose/arabinose dehydrogenase
MRRITLSIAIAILGMGLAVALGIASNQPLGADPTFNETSVAIDTVAGGTWFKPTGAVFLPDGRLIVVEEEGLVRLVTTTTGTATNLFTVPDLLTQGETGLLDVAIDPSFATNNYFYTYQTELSTRRLRVDRYTFTGTGAQMLASRSVVWKNQGPALGPDNYHVGGSLNFGNDGKLYLSTGDNYVNENSQLLTNSFGKVLRFNVDGTVPSDNPFFDGVGAGGGSNIDEIWAYGIRNGYRGWIDPTDGRYLLGDVGGNDPATAYEEVNVIKRGLNYGWADCEGPLGPPKVGANCPGGVEGPIYSYPHSVSGGCCANRAIVGGEIYRKSAFPASLVGSYIYADYATATIYWMTEHAGSAPTSGVLKSGAGIPVWVGVSPTDGNIYYVNFGYGNGSIRRLRYTGAASSPPVITTSSATPTSGAVPLTVNFSGAATDANGDPITYSWAFGDSTTSTSASPTKVYSTAGVYSAQLTVTAAGDVVTAAPITITVGTPPVATFISPPDHTVFQAGQTLVFTGSGADAQDGPLTGASLAWTILFRHDTHTHSVTTGTGSSISYSVPLSGGHDWTGATGYDVTLTATDSSGLTHSVTRAYDPQKVIIPFTANIPVNVVVDGITKATPTSLDTIAASQHPVSIPATVCVSGVQWTFASWSSGATRDHTLTAAAAAPALVATYTSGGPCAATVYRAININGNAVTIDGFLWESHVSAPNYSSGPAHFCDTAVPLIPPTGAAETEMVQCSSYGSGNGNTTLTNVPNGNYTVEFWTWEDNNSEVFTPALNGVALPTITSGIPGTWSKKGPYPVAVSTGVIALTTTGGAANISGIRVNFGAPDTAPPSVVSVSPTDAATGIATTAAPAITFSEPIVAGSGTITLAIDGGAAVTTTVNVSGSVATLNHATPLAANTTYRVTATTGVTDLAGNALAPAFTSTFTTGIGDSTPPTVVSVNPLNAATGISIAVAPTITFSEPVLPDSALSLAVVGGAAVSITPAVSGSTITLNHATPLLPATTYRITATTGITDLSGNAMAATFTSTFTTAAAADTTAPTVVSVNPTNAATGVAVAAAPAITFSEPVTPGSAITLAVVGGATVATTPSVSGNVVTLNHAAPLAAGTTYRIAATAVPDLAGNTLATPFTSTFTTAAAASAGPIKVSRSATRTPAVGLDGNVWAAGEQVYVFLDTPDAAVNVKFFLDGVLKRAEGLAPWDFNGGGIATATPFANTLANGSHTITTTLTRPDGTTQNASATFTVGTVTVDTTPPTVVSVTPPNGAAAIGVGTAPVITFSEPVVPGSAITLAIDGGAVVTTTASVAGSSVTLNHAAALATATTYRITATTGVTDVAGNPMAATFTSTFTTAAAPDTTPPTVVSVNPVSAATAVAVTTAPTITFSESVVPGSAITLAVNGGATFATTPSVSGGVVTLNHATPLAPATVYRITATTGVTDLAGNPLGATFTSTFTTAGVVDTAPPSVVSVNPANAATAIAISASPSITFSEPVLPGSAITLAVNGGATVATTTGVSGNVVSLNHATPLTAGTVYRITVTTGVTDLAGNAMAATFTSTFTTATATVTPLPIRVSRATTRSPAVNLQGNTWAAGEQVYVFLDTTEAAVNVKFYLDTPTTGTPRRTEGLAPWDFNGGGITTATAFVNNLTPGVHTIRTVLTRPNGTTVTETATFTVV